MKKYFCHFLILFILAVFFIFADNSLLCNNTLNYSASQTVYYALPPEEDIVSPCSDDIRWYYKSIDGVVYRRKYNYTKKSGSGTGNEYNLTT